MDLYKIMLVDDEEEVRTSIIKKINWEANGFEVVGDAENGRDALEKIENLEPNVIITDIRMPYMDGLALTENIRQRFPSIKVIIFSGFDDFTYAKEAIRLGVTEYILKPVNVDELTEILKKVRAKLDEEIESARNIDSLRESYKASLPVLREQFLNKLIIKKGFYDENAILIADPDHSNQAEDRFIILGLSTELHMLLVCHCYKENDRIRIISARKANLKESKEYGDRL